MPVPPYGKVCWYPDIENCAGTPMSYTTREMPFVLSFALIGYRSRATTYCLQQFTSNKKLNNIYTVYKTGGGIAETVNARKNTMQPKLVVLWRHII